MFLTDAGEKRLMTSEDTKNTTPPKEGEIPTPQPEDVDSEVHELGEIVTTTGDVDVVEEETNFTSASVHVLIGEIMVCNRDLEKIKENINDVQQKMKNIIDVLGRIQNIQKLYRFVVTCIMAEQVSGIMIPRAWEEMPVENLMSCRLLPVAKYRKVATSPCSGVMACRMQ
ncbi:hypothetical protein AB205_0096510, partial [Aquarana catesbeiana]